MLFEKKNGVSWLLVFLGNPGTKYEKTRHNVGFMAGDALSKKQNVKIDRIKYSALICRTELDGEPVMLMKPQTYMNLSGTAVKEAMDFYKIPLDHVVVVSDDVTLPVGKLRVRRSGSAGGHNGLKDIIAKCGGDGFPRVKVGVGEKPHPDYDMADWVLSSFKGDDAKVIEAAVEKAADAVKTIVLKGIDKAMNLYN